MILFIWWFAIYQSTWVQTICSSLSCFVIWIYFYLKENISTILRQCIVYYFLKYVLLYLTQWLELNWFFVAHGLAHHAVNMNESCFWVSNIPSWLSMLLLADLTICNSLDIWFLFESVAKTKWFFLHSRKFMSKEQWVLHFRKA